MPAMSNHKVMPTAPEQQTHKSFEFRKERIDAAFASNSKHTRPANNADADDLFIPNLNREHAGIGVRLSAPADQSTLIGFVTERRWHGHILSVDNEGKFWARVYDEHSPDDRDIEEAQFDAEEVPDLMRHLVKPGGIFFWDIGFKVEPSGQRIRQSILSFPMIPRITERDKVAAKERAKQRFKMLGWDRPQNGQSSQPKDAAQG